MFQELKELVAAYKARDPAARSTAEILLLYPGVRALRSHRRAHWCYMHGYKLLARWISQASRRRTGIETHPGAKVLGPFRVGDNSRIAANAVVLTEIPPNSTAVGVPAKVVRIDGHKVDYVGSVDQVNVTDPISTELQALHEILDGLQKKIEKLEADKS